MATGDKMAMHIVVWKPKATNTHSEHVMILAFLLSKPYRPDLGLTQPPV